MAKVKAKDSKIAPVYDPSTNYKWEPGDEFVLTGIEFSKLYNTLQALAHSSSDIPPIDKVNCFHILEDLLKKAVEEGVATALPAL